MIVLQCKTLERGCDCACVAGYWESLLQQLKAHMAKTRLRERHQEVLRRKLFKLKQEVGRVLFPEHISFPSIICVEKGWGGGLRGAYSLLLVYMSRFESLCFV